MNKDECKRLSDVLMAAGVGMLLGGLCQLGVYSGFLTWLGGAAFIMFSYIVIRFLGDES